MQMELSKSEKGNTRLRVDGAYYYKYYDAPDGRTHWRCGRYRTKCKAKLITNKRDEVTIISNEHNHKDDPYPLAKESPAAAARAKPSYQMHSDEAAQKLKKFNINNKIVRNPPQVRRTKMGTGSAAPKSAPTRRESVLHQLPPFQPIRLPPLPPVQPPAVAAVHVPPIRSPTPTNMQITVEEPVKMEPLSSSTFESSTEEEDPIAQTKDADAVSPSRQVPVPASPEVPSFSNLKRPAESDMLTNESEITAKKIAYQLQSLDGVQRIIAEKLISDAVFNGKFGNLRANSCLKLEP